MVAKHSGDGSLHVVENSRQYQLLYIQNFDFQGLMTVSGCLSWAAT